MLSIDTIVCDLLGCVHEYARFIVCIQSRPLNSTKDTQIFLVNFSRVSNLGMLLT